MKRFLIAVLTVLFLLTACGGRPEDTSVPTVETAPSQPTDTEPADTAPAEEPGLLCEGVGYDCLDDLMEAMASQGRLEQEAHSITIEGLSTPVTLHMSYETLVAYTAWDYTFDVEPEALPHTGLHGNVSADLYDHEGVPILNVWYYDMGYTLIMLEDGSWTHHPREGRSRMVYADGEGQLLCSEVSTKFNGSVEQWDTAPIDLAVSRDEFYYATGTCTIDGTDVQPVFTQEQTISDAFDLDQIFTDAKAQGLYPQFDTLDQLLEWNWADSHQPEAPQEAVMWYHEAHREDGSLRARIGYFGEQKVTAELYDLQGRLTDISYYDGNGQAQVLRYTYDEEGHCTGMSFRDREEELWSYTMTYDAEGRLLQRTRARSGNPTGVQSFSYDADGGHVETFSQNGVDKFSCHYDADGTLIRHMVYRDGQAVETPDPGSLVKTQQVLEARIPALDNSPIVYSFRYDGTDLIYSSAFYGPHEEYAYDGSIHRPLDGTVYPEHEEEQLKSVYSYEGGIMTGEKLYSDGELVCSYTYTWDGDTETEQCVFPDGTPGSQVRRTYEDGRLVVFEEDGGYRTVYDYSADGRTVEVTNYLEGAWEGSSLWRFDEAGRRVSDQDRSYEYRDGMLEQVLIRSDEFFLGSAIFDWYEVWATPAQAKDLTDTFNEVLDWLA